MATAGTVTIKLDGDSATLIRELNKANRAADSTFSEISRGAGELAQRLAVISTAAAVAFAALIKHSLEAVDALAKAADRIGISTEALATLQVAADLAGVSQETLNKALLKQQKLLADAADGSAGAAGALAALGLQTQDLIGLDADKQFALIAERLNGVDNVTRRNAIAMEIWGAKLVTMINLALEAGGGLANLGEQMARINVAVSRFDAAKIEQANDAIKLAKTAAEGFGNSLATAVAPYIRQIGLEFFNAAVEADGFRKVAQSSVEQLATVIGHVGDGVLGIRLAFETLAGAALIAFGSIQGAVAGAGLVIQRTFIAPIAVILEGWARIAGLFPGVLGEAGEAATDVAGRLKEGQFLLDGWKDAQMQIAAGFELIGTSWRDVGNQELPSDAFARWAAKARAEADRVAAEIAAAAKGRQEGSEGTSGQAGPARSTVDVLSALEAARSAAAQRLALEQETAAEIRRIAITGEQATTDRLRAVLEQRAQILTDQQAREAAATAKTSGEAAVFDREQALAKNRLTLAEETAKSLLAMRSAVVDAGWIINLRVEADAGGLADVRAEAEATAAKLAALRGKRLDIAVRLTDPGATEREVDGIRQRLADLRSALTAVESSRPTLAVDSEAYAHAGARIELLREQIAGLEGREVAVRVAVPDLAEVERRLATLRGELAAVQADQPTLAVDSAAYPAASARVERLQAEITALDGRRVQLVAALDGTQAGAELAKLDAHIAAVQAHAATPPQIAGIAIDFSSIVDTLAQASERQKELSIQSSEEVRRIVLAGESQISTDLINLMEARAQAMVNAEQRQAELRAVLAGSPVVFDRERELGETRVRLANETADAIIDAQRRVAEGGAAALPTVDVGAIRLQTEQATQAYLEAWQLAQAQRLEADQILQSTLYDSEAAAGQALIELAGRQAREKVLAEFQARGQAMAETGEIADPAVKADFERQVQEETLTREQEFLNQRLRMQQAFGQKYAEIQRAIGLVFGREWSASHKKALTLTAGFASAAMNIAGALFAENKKVAIAQAVVSTLVGVTNALADVRPYPLNLAAAASVLASGFAQVSAIRSASVGGGGAGGGIGGAAGGTTLPTGLPVGPQELGKQDRGAVNITLNGPFVGWDKFVQEQVLDAIRDAVDGKDVVIFSGASRQAQIVREGG